LLLTDVPGVYTDPDADPQVLRHLTAGHLRARDLAAGWMGPKAEAAARFTAGGGMAAIGALADAQGLLAGEAGTQVTADELRVARADPRADAVVSPSPCSDA
jgi:carbamate kinase